MKDQLRTNLAEKKDVMSSAPEAHESIGKFQSVLNKIQRWSRAAILAAIPAFVSCNPQEPANKHQDLGKDFFDNSTSELAEKAPYDRMVTPMLSHGKTITVQGSFPKKVYIKAQVLNSDEEYNFESDDNGGEFKFNQEATRIIPGYTIKAATDLEMKNEVQIEGDSQIAAKNTDMIWGHDHAVNADTIYVSKVGKQQ